MEKLICNCCGKELKVEQGIAKEDYLHVRKAWGYFSKKDGRTQEFILCEDCVEQMAKNFAVPTEFSDTIEMI